MNNLNKLNNLIYQLKKGKEILIDEWNYGDDSGAEYLGFNKTEDFFYSKYVHDNIGKSESIKNHISSRYAMGVLVDIACKEEKEGLNLTNIKLNLNQIKYYRRRLSRWFGI